MNLVDRFNGERSLTAISRTLRFGRIAANTSVPTTTYAYDANGNLTQKSVDGQITAYVWDYANRLSAVGSSGATTTFGYDASGARVFQSTATTTTLYPSRWYSVASSTGTGAKYATTTAYVFGGDTLLATVDRAIVSGTATGSPVTSFIHPDHLGSTNVVPNASGTVVQVLDYYPYGAARINSSTGGADQKKKFVGMERDANGLDYARARYYDNTRGQFLSEDPVFWEIGLTPDGRAVLSDPQLQNGYSWGRDNPITKKDPDGRCPWCLPFLIGGAAGGLSQYASDILANRAAGITGMAAYAPRSSWQEYNAAVAAGAVTGAVATAGLIYGGIAATLGSGVQDWAGGNNINPGKAVITGLTTVATGGFFKWGAGASPAEIYMQSTGRSFSSLPSNIFRNDLRYNVTNEVLGGSVSGIIQSRYQSVQSINASTGASTGGGGSMPSNSSLWVTPSGAVVTFGGQLVVGPAAQSTPATIKR